MATRLNSSMCNGDASTKDRILDCALELFALHGYSAVSVNDIAKEVGVQKSALYHHYANKDALLEDIMARFEKDYRSYFAWLSKANKKAQSLEEVMDNLFNKDFIEMNDERSCFGMAIALKEERNNDSAHKRAYQLLWGFSTQQLKKDFDRLIVKGLIPPADTYMLAVFFMTFLVVINEIRIGEFLGKNPTVNRNVQFKRMRKFMTSALTKGV